MVYVLRYRAERSSGLAHPRTPRASKGDGKGRETLGAGKKGAGRGGEGKALGRFYTGAFLDKLLF